MLSVVCIFYEDYMLILFLASNLNSTPFDTCGTDFYFFDIQNKIGSSSKVFSCTLTNSILIGVSIIAKLFCV